MTESYDVVQQPQKRVGMGLPIGMAAVGAGAGILANNISAKGMSPEEIAKLFAANDTVEISSKLKNADSATIEEAKKLAAEVQDLKAKLAEASKAKLPDTSKEQQLLNEAKEKLANEIKRLQGIEDAKAGKVIGSSFTARKDIPKFSELTPEQLPNLVHKKGANKGKAFTNEEISDLYETLVKSLDDAERNLAPTLAPLNANVSSAENTMRAYCTTAKSRLSGKKNKEVSKYFNPKNSGSKLYEDITNAIASEYPVPKKLTDKQISEFATRLEPGAPKTKGFTTAYIDIINEKGWLEKGVKVEYDPEVARNRLKELQNEARERIASVRTEIMESTKKAYDLQGALDELPTSFQETLKGKVKIEKIKATGLYDDAAGVFDLATVRSEGARYEKAIENLDKAIKASKKPGGAKATVPSGFAKLEADPAKALEQLKKRKSVFDMYGKEQTRLQTQLTEAYHGCEQYRTAQSKVNKAVNGCKPLEQARKKLANMFPGVAKFTEGETTATGKRITESDVGKTFRDAVDNAQKAVDEAIAKGGGTVDEAAKKVAQEAFDGKNKVYQEKLAQIGKDTKISKLFGGKKGPAIAIGAAALFLIGLGIRSSKNKKQQQV